MSVVDLADVVFTWPRQKTPTLQINEFIVEAGERVFLSGPSGSGKTTLLGIIAGIHSPNAGRARVVGQDLKAMSQRQRDHFRAEHLGYLFQMFNLLPYLSVIENVCLPCHFSRTRREKALSKGHALEAEAQRLLSDLQLSPDLARRPVTELSIGQQQRVAAARALMGQPELVIADEPTSSLDWDVRESFIQLLFDECRRENSTLLMVSHDRSLADLFDRQVNLKEINQGGAA